jgi:hypothetical protein
VGSAGVAGRAAVARPSFLPAGVVAGARARDGGGTAALTVGVGVGVDFDNGTAADEGAFCDYEGRSVSGLEKRASRPALAPEEDAEVGGFDGAVDGRACALPASTADGGLRVAGGVLPPAVALAVLVAEPPATELTGGLCAAFAFGLSDGASSGRTWKRT